jgi:AraC-like DNA-binding protein
MGFNGNGYTRVSALGPMAHCLDAQGGRIQRVFERSDIPLEILGQPDLPLRLRDQYRLLHAAAQEVGDPYFGATMGSQARTQSLTTYGQWVTGAPTLGQAIHRGNRELNRLMQTDTVLDLRPEKKHVLWAMRFFTPGHGGRFQNELLALGYLLDTLRFYLGRGWVPTVLHVIGDAPGQAPALATIYGAPVRLGQDVCGVVFPPDLLKTPRPRLEPTDPDAPHPLSQPRPALPRSSWDVSAIQSALEMEVLAGYPAIDRVADRLGLTRRTLQRRLERTGATFSTLADILMRRRAERLLGEDRMDIGMVSDAMGYSDPAHFTRAFRRWTGQSPSQFRAALSLMEGTPRRDQAV